MHTQESFYKEANKWKNIFLTGLAGSGKSFAIKKLINDTPKLNTIITAPTWVAAINIWGATIHSVFKIFWNNYKVSNQIIDWNSIDRLIIDEISMVSCYLFDLIDSILRRNRDKDKPFWWLQVICIWDLNQLPPIFNMNDLLDSKRFNDKKWKILFNNSESYKKWKFKKINLTVSFRSTNDYFNELLNRIRDWDLSALKEFQRWNIDDAIHLMPYNNMVDNYNEKKLHSIQWNLYTFIGKIKWEFNLSNVITPEELKIKIGAKIMVTINSYWLVNWDTWIIKKISDNIITIYSTRLWCDIDIVKNKFKSIVYDSNWQEIERWSFTQFPLRLAWAITVHKCIDWNQLIKGEWWRFKISNWQIWDKVYTANWIYSIIWKQYMWKKDTIKITTRTWLELISTNDHRILTSIWNSEEYLEAWKLSIWNKLIINRDIREWWKDIKIPIAELSHRGKQVIYPDYIDNDFSYYIWLLIWDWSYNYKKDWRLDIESQDIEISNFLKYFYNKLNINLLIRNKKHSKSYTHIVTSRNLRDTLSNIWLDYITWKDKIIPDCFNNMSIERRWNILSWLFDTDWHISKKWKIIFTSTSIKLIKQMQLMLLDLWIISSIYKMKLYSINHNQSYQLVISWNNNIVLFQKYIWFKIWYKKELLTNYISSWKSIWKTNIDFIINSDEIKKEFKKELWWKWILWKWYSQDKRMKGVLSLTNLSYTHLAYLNNFSLSKWIILPILNKTLNKNYYYDDIISIEENWETDVYDLEIDTEHSFIAQWIVVHNCQGLTLDKVVFHYNSSLSKELIYVAVSRCTTYEWLFIN